MKISTALIMAALSVSLLCGCGRSRRSGDSYDRVSKAELREEILEKYCEDYNIPEEYILAYLGERPAGGEETASLLLILDKTGGSRLLREFQEDVDAYHRAE